MSEPKTVTLEKPFSFTWHEAVSLLDDYERQLGGSAVLRDLRDGIKAQLPKPDTFGYSAVIKDTKGRIWQNNRHGTDYTHRKPWYCVDTERYGEFSDFAVAEVLFVGVPFDKLDNATEEVPW